MFDARVMGAAERPEAEAEDVAVVGAVANEERSVGLVGELRLGGVERQRTPVPFALQTAKRERQNQL